MSSTEKLRIPLETILSATNNFAETNKIGEGGFGRVYRGKSRKHGLLAIKRLNSNNGQGAHEYGMEVTLLSKYKHENLVSLIGFCGEGDEKIIVYKYEANQSLDKALYRKDLSWTDRLQICLGAARGLSYLHTGSGSQNGIIHRDIKSSNILLDENWNAKISDFGLSKITITNSPDSVVFSAACGTNGYIDPQILKDQMTQKSDVYSFGVVMYEVLFAKLVALVDDPHHFTIDKAKKHYEKKTLHMMIDPELSDEMNFKSMSLFSTIAYECLKDVSEYRPTMAKVVEELERALEFQQVTSTRKSIGSSSSGYLYDVYISFKAGTEFIVNHILDALNKENLSSYLESSGGCNQRSAIKLSRSFIIIFSAHFDEDYCNLSEVQEIIKCVKERRNVVIPVFWNVHPSEVKIQNEYIDEAISKLKSAAVWRDSIIGVNYGYPLEASVFNKHSHGLAREAAGRLRFQLFGPKERKGNQLEGNERKGKKSQGNDAMVTMENPNYAYLPPIVPIHHLNPVSPSPYNNPYYPHPGPGVWFPHHSPSPYPSIHPPLPPQYVYYEEYFDNGNLQ